MSAQLSGTEAREARENIEEMFRQYCGAISEDVLPGARAQWQSNYEERLATLKRYIDILAELIADAEVRRAFSTEASRRMIKRYR